MRSECVQGFAPLGSQKGQLHDWTFRKPMAIESHKRVRRAMGLSKRSSDGLSGQLERFWPRNKRCVRFSIEECCNRASAYAACQGEGAYTQRSSSLERVSGPDLANSRDNSWKRASSCAGTRIVGPRSQWRSVGCPTTKNSNAVVFASHPNG
jgi:hypothetical protein